MRKFDELVAEFPEIYKPAIPEKEALRLIPAIPEKEVFLPIPERTIVPAVL